MKFKLGKKKVSHTLYQYSDQITSPRVLIGLCMIRSPTTYFSDLTPSLAYSTLTNKHPSLLFLEYISHTSATEPLHLLFPHLRTLISQYLPGSLLHFLQISAHPPPS